MIFGIGTDIVEIKKINSIYKKFGQKFLNRVFSKSEIDYFTSKSSLKSALKSLAVRFSAKEAFVKALGIGIRNGINFKDINVEVDDLGKPYLILRGESLNMINNFSITRYHLTLSHSNDYAIAVVLLECDDVKIK